MLTEKIEKELTPLVKELGCDIVRVKLFQSGESKTLQVMIEKSDYAAASIVDCERVSKAVSISLDVTNPIKGQYNLEISSAGIDRPLVKPADFKRFCGKQIVVNTYVLKNGRKVFKGNLEFASEYGIRVVLDVPLLNGENAVSLQYDEISSAHLDEMKF